jgi:general stress protein YciG
MHPPRKSKVLSSNSSTEKREREGGKEEAWKGKRQKREESGRKGGKKRKCERERKKYTDSLLQVETSLLCK